jgi:hypothetical protein
MRRAVAVVDVGPAAATVFATIEAVGSVATMAHERP